MSEVYAIFATIGEHIPFKKKEKIGEANSEGSINLLHYRATVLVIICFCLLVTSVDLIAGKYNQAKFQNELWTLPNRYENILMNLFFCNSICCWRLERMILNDFPIFIIVKLPFIEFLLSI